MALASAGVTVPLPLESPAPPDPYAIGRVDERARIVALIRGRATALRAYRGSEAHELSMNLDDLANDLERGARE